MIQPIKDALYHLVSRFLLAVSFFTRLPVGRFVTYTDERMHEAGSLFPWVGWLLALILCAAYSVLSSVFEPAIGVFIIMALSVLLTGAFHEDGLADTADAFGGGQDSQHKLVIMKDSRLGTYGVCALTGALVGKWLLLTLLAQQAYLVPALCLAYPLSRAMALSHIQDLPYAVDTTSGKASKSMPFSQPFNTATLVFMLASGALMLVILPWQLGLMIVIGSAALRLILKQRMHKHIQGFTGDTLGAAQQLQELLIYFLFIAYLGPTS
ncbi:adenosylcobinamide-GDP ribazoletransferase [Alteromonas sp. 14N.309.X.WAT.G.H12]|uniref:adenosylcobinamide-GDP ribazoletransferase n=1 Tax=Alteromonas sp. 14N.309.X.WAT.G.H12 TaxID=3120824 RepID=UPI002FD60417